MKPDRAKLFPGVAILALSLLSLPPMGAQTAGAALSGKVASPTGAAVPDARVSVRNVSSGQVTKTQTGPDGTYRVPQLAPGAYEVTIEAGGFAAQTATVTLAAGATQTMDVSLAAPSVSPSAPSLGDLGFTPAQTRGNAREQALLDKRSHMLKIHQRLGLITTAPLLATIIASSRAGGRSSSTSGRDLHAALGIATAGMYITTASYAILAPKVPGTPTRGPIRLHKALAWIHGPGMILTPILGALAYQQRNRGERVHGIAKEHSVVAVVTSAAFGLAVVSVSFKF